MKKCRSKKRHRLSKVCEAFYQRPFPYFYPPQIKEKRISIRKDLKVRKVKDVLIHGQIKDCITHEGISGMIVKAFYEDDLGELKGICHTFSGCKGYYMLNIPPKFEGKILTIMAAKTNCSKEPIPCECPEE